jgi:hypothetical protein
MLLKISPPPALAAVALIVISSAVVNPQPAWSADLRIPKPAVRHDTPSDWRTQLFENFRRYLQRRNQ